jgi:putative ABC transport system ATP-binding protein
VLADEPTGNLDSKTGDAILALLYRLWDESGLTVAVITHDPAISESAPRVIRLADGQVISDERVGGRGRAAVLAGADR